MHTILAARRVRVVVGDCGSTLSRSLVARWDGTSSWRDLGIRSWRGETTLKLSDCVEKVGDLEDTIASSDGSLSQHASLVQVVHRVVRPFARSADGLCRCLDRQDRDAR